MNKPLMRWVMGNCADHGFETLEVSVKHAKNLYPHFDFLICYNNLKESQLKIIKRFGVKTFDQTSKTYPKTPEKAEWLLWPARMRLNAHEIRIDNDLILIKKHPIIEEFLSNKNMFFATSGIRNTTPYYGSYLDCVPEENGTLNSGICGFPPGYRLKNKIIEFYKKYGVREYKHTNPQGIIAALIKSNKNYKLISNKEIRILRRFDKLKTDEGTYGYHLVGINRFSEHKAWKELKNDFYNI